MKYLILVPDGAADEPIESLGGKTPLEAANMPFVNERAMKGIVGMVKTIPDGVAPGSDAANLSVMGYDPFVYLTGRAPLEAVSMGLEMLDTDVAFRTNLVTLSGEGEYEELTIIDHSSGDISTKEAAELIETIQAELGSESINFFPGVSYRHCMIVNNGGDSFDLTPPHDILMKKVGDYLPTGENQLFINQLMKKSYQILKNHPINIKRIENGLRPANSIWIWGQGKKPALSSFHEKYGITGAAISAVDLIKGIALCAGLDSVDVEGATGTIHTNFSGKAKAAIGEYMKGKDFVYMHLEAPDECSHQGDLEGKIKSLEIIDNLVLKPIIDYLESLGEPYKALVVPDHRTPLRIRTHSSDPVPFVLFSNEDYDKEIDNNKAFSEVAGEKGMYFDSGHALADYFFKK